MTIVALKSAKANVFGQPRFGRSSVLSKVATYELSNWQTAKPNKWQTDKLADCQTQ